MFLRRAVILIFEIVGMVTWDASFLLGELVMSNPGMLFIKDIRYSHLVLVVTYIIRFLYGKESARVRLWGWIGGNNSCEVH